MSLYYEQPNRLFQSAPMQIIVVNENHPLVIPAKNIPWKEMFEELVPILYKNINRFIGRRLDLRAHCGIYLLQAVYHWTDRFAEEMLRNYAPARIFCG